MLVTNNFGWIVLELLLFVEFELYDLFLILSEVRFFIQFVYVSLMKCYWDI